MSVQVARRGKVTIGTYQIAEMGVWSLAGFTNQVLDSTEFGDEFSTFEFGIGSFGTISFNGNYSLEDDNTGQSFLKSVWLNKVKIPNNDNTDARNNELRLYVNAANYYAVDWNTTNKSMNYILITQVGAIEFDKAGLGRISFAAQISGSLKYV